MSGSRAGITVNDIELSARRRLNDVMAHLGLAEGDPSFAAELLNRVVGGVTGVRTGLHVCRGNWSRREDVLLTGDYHALLPALKAMKVDQFVLEYATPRAGELDREVLAEQVAGDVPGKVPRPMTKRDRMAR